MITVLFGLAGAGKNYVGQVLSQHSNFYFWDADELITAEMRSCIAHKVPLTQEICDQYFSLVMAHLEILKMQHDNIVFSQVFYKNKNRREFLSRFPDAQFIQVRADFEIINQRLARRERIYSVDYLRKINIGFETPDHPYFLIDNEVELSNELLVAQFMTIPHLAAHIKLPHTDQAIIQNVSADLLIYFEHYNSSVAPFMHRHLQEVRATRPLQGMRVLHHVPVVPNTLLKIACLVEAGAEVVVTNPSFMKPDPVAVESLRSAGIHYAETFEELKNEKFHVYFDCGAELYQALGAPEIGAIELTGSGDHYYRQQQLNFPVLSIDPTKTKQLETVFGCAESSHTAIAVLTGHNPAEKSWIIFGFGKIGRGLAYFCRQHGTKVCVVDVSKKQREAAKELGLMAIDPTNHEALKLALLGSEIVVTATGGKAILAAYPREWFNGKILANMGIYDEYGPNFDEKDVLNAKKPINFVHKDPTPMVYIDPEFYIHNIAVFFFTQHLNPGVHELPEAVDENIIQQWVMDHHFSITEIQEWFASLGSIAAAKKKQNNAPQLSRKKASEFYGVSKTAFFATYWKNQAKSKNNWPELVQKLGTRQKDLFKDPFMTYFVDQEIGDEAEQCLNKKMWLPMATRTRFFRRNISQAIKKQGMKQVILLGSGFDTLAVRKEKYSQLFDVKFFEVDLANILDCKQAIYKKHKLNTNAEYIRIDYVKENLIARLCDHGVDFSKPTIILWEGNTFYLEKEEVVRILQNLAQQFSNLIMTFDYMHPALSTNQQVSTIKTMQEEFTKRQSPLKTFFEPEELVKLCESLGLRCGDHKTAAKLAEEYEVDQEPYVTASMYSVVTCSK